jgi:hypothetical protein
MKDWKYILYVAGAIGIFVLVKLTAPKQYNWGVTFAHEDRDPYGAYVLNRLLPSLIGNNNIRHSYRTLYELKDSLNDNDNVFIVSSSFNPGKEDSKALLHHIANGGRAFIAAEYWWGTFADTLDLNTHDFLFSDGGTDGKDSTYLNFANPKLDTLSRYWFEKDNIHRYFVGFDSTRTTIIAKNSYQQPVTVKLKWGKGEIILNSTPLVFTNIYLLAKNNHTFAAKNISYLPPSRVHWTEYYHVGRMEAATPLRFILTTEPLRWAYYITLFAILIFMVFEAKRKQRIIPVMKPLPNTTLEFVATIGNLYYQTGNHKNIAEKKITFLLEQIRTRFLISTNTFDDNFFEAVAVKSGNNKSEVMALFRAIMFVQQSTEISADQLIDLNNKIEHFNAPKS